MRIVPNSTITLYKDVEIDNGEQLAFSSLQKQTAYFQSKIHPQGSYTPCTVNRKNGALKVEKSGSVVSQCNYLSFINPSFDNKTVYARIIDYDYINNECTEIKYVIDYWQTWMFDVTFDNMYIEREHLSQADFTKAQTNPYDPSILEFRTLETLPVSKDIEKPYYTYGNSNASDGIFIKDAICHDNNLPNRNGILFIFSDVGLSNVDGEEGAGLNQPSDILCGLISTLVVQFGQTLNNLCFYNLSISTYEYLHTHYGSNIPARVKKGTQWGTLNPMGGSTLDTPINYVYIDTTDPSEDAYQKFSNMLGWFTDNSCLDNILGIYPIPTGMMYMSAAVRDGNLGAEILCKHTTGKTQNVVNKKLDLYPFCYYRIITPNGDVKELHIEDFKDAQDGLNYCEIGLSLDIVEKPNLIVAPRKYKASGASPNLSINLNVNEGLIFTQFPTLPYSIDAFRMQMAAVVNNIIGNNTIDYSYEIQQKQLNLYKGLSGQVGSATQAVSNLMSGNIGGAVSSAVDFVLGGAQYDIERGRTKNEFAMSEDAYKVLTGNKDNAVIENFKYTKPAYAANEYHQINGDGITNFNINSFMDILFLKVSINPTILAQYDNYFSHYGYASGRCGMPRVINFTRGSTTATDIPHWQTLNNKLTTYIKTTDCRVIHSMLPVAQFIKEMFDNGVRMIKGDLT